MYYLFFHIKSITPSIFLINMLCNPRKAKPLQILINFSNQITSLVDFFGIHFGIYVLHML